MKLKILKLEQMFVYIVNHFLSRFLHMYSNQVLQVRPLQNPLSVRHSVTPSEKERSYRQYPVFARTAHSRNLMKCQERGLLRLNRKIYFPCKNNKSQVHDRQMKT